MTTEESSPLAHNQPEYSVSELSGAIKRTMEGAFGRVRVRGEISGFKRAASGHLYMDLKDDKAVLNGVCWKGVAGRLAMQPQDGLEVICTGRISTFPGRSNYQIVIEQMEPAGEGALMALLEKRKRELAAEGLFDPARKQLLPYLPRVIGVVTSPTGSVIRDILHRIEDRFPMRVLVWPVAVQGKGAEAQIAAAIEGFNRLEEGGAIPRPDVVIVARGGGSIEDLWCFNEEIVVRAAAASSIPLISAVGHETDTTLIDYAADQRAPTPTAAAEMAAPVLADLRYTLSDHGGRLDRAALRRIEQLRQQVEALGRGLLSPETMLEVRMQRVDEWGERLGGAMRARMQRAQERVAMVSERLRAGALMEKTAQHDERLDGLVQRLHRAWHTRFIQEEERLQAVARMLEALNHQAVLQRGFSYVTDSKGAVVSSASGLKDAPVQLHFQDGEATVARCSAPKKRKATTPASAALGAQQQLF